MKRLITLLVTLALCAALAVPALAYNYDFSSGPDSGSTFGGYTGYDDPVSPDPMSENVRRNKDAAYLPPPYFYGSGEIPTDPSSLYHDNTPNGAGSGYGSAGYENGTAGGNAPAAINQPPASGMEAPTSTIAQNTEPLYYSDGSIGTLYVAKTGKTIKVYQGEQLDNLKRGAGHFAITSAWDGNVGLCGHNRGSWPYFSFVKDLKKGDRITYTTRYGTRTYEVFSLEQIGEYDYSKLGWSAENLLTLITCVAGTPELRYAACLRQVV